MRPVDIAQHGRDDVQREETEGICEEADAGDYDDPYLERGGIDCLERPSSAS
jgi:hypothetical protein